MDWKKQIFRNNPDSIKKDIKEKRYGYERENKPLGGYPLS